MNILRVISLSSVLLFFVHAEDLEEIGLTNARQSSTETRYGCSEEKPIRCAAENAIDNNLHSMAYTDVESTGWLEAELEEVATIDQIHLYLTTYGFKKGYYKKLKVETKLLSTDDWTTCKDVFSVKVFQGIRHPQVVQCDQPTMAKFVRVYSELKHGLRLREVEVFGETGDGRWSEIGLKNARQSSTETRYGCSEEKPIKCAAENAIDKNLHSMAYTDVESTGWLEAELEEVATINQIHLYLTTYGFDKGYYSKMKVETKLHSKDDWRICKGVFSVEVFHGIRHPHVVQCDQPTKAKFLRISSELKHGLRLREVKVFGRTG